MSNEQARAKESAERAEAAESRVQALTEQVAQLTAELAAKQGDRDYWHDSSIAEGKAKLRAEGELRAQERATQQLSAEVTRLTEALADAERADLDGQPAAPKDRLTQAVERATAKAETGEHWREEGRRLARSGLDVRCTACQKRQCDGTHVGCPSYLRDEPAAPARTDAETMDCESCAIRGIECDNGDHCDSCGNRMDGYVAATADVCHDCWQAAKSRTEAESELAAAQAEIAKCNAAIAKRLADERNAERAENQRLKTELTALRERVARATAALTRNHVARALEALRGR